jgi:hypothetical protein
MGYLGHAVQADGKQRSGQEKNRPGFFANNWLVQIILGKTSQKAASCYYTLCTKELKNV